MSDTFFKRHLIVSMFLGSLLMLAGIFLMFQQASFVRFFISLLGVFLVFSGISSLFALKKYQLGSRSKMATLIQAFLSILVGLVAVLVPLFTAAVSWTILLYVIAVELLLSACISFLDAMLLKKSSIVVSGLLTEGVLSLFVAVLLLVFPKAIGTLLLKLFGVILIATGLGMFLWSLRIRQINKQFRQDIIEGKATVVEESPSS
ncbi:MAG: hypothetical protein EOM15_10305 [Spirochaetia bacterium]|nr:hypothetical protein [Spirochaetia bacterium]